MQLFAVYAISARSFFVDRTDGGRAFFQDFTVAPSFRLSAVFPSRLVNNAGAVVLPFCGLFSPSSVAGGLPLFFLFDVFAPSFVPSCLVYAFRV